MRHIHVAHFCFAIAFKMGCGRACMRLPGCMIARLQNCQPAEGPSRPRRWLAWSIAELHSLSLGGSIATVLSCYVIMATARLRPDPPARRLGPDSYNDHGRI